MNDVKMFWSLCAECVEFLSQMRSGAVLMESRHGEGQTDKQGLYQRKSSDSHSHLLLYTCAVVLKSLHGDHDIRLIQDEHFEGLQPECFVSVTPVHHCARCPDDDVVGDCLPS